MKKLILIIVLFSFAQINAQEIFIPRTSIGIGFGMNMPSVSFNPRISQNQHFTYFGGIAFTHISENYLGVQIELNFSQRGWEENNYGQSIYNRKLNYIELPFMTHFELGSSKTKIYLNGGPMFSYLLSDDEEINTSDLSEYKDYYDTNIDNRFEFGYCIGLGFTKITSIGIFQLEGRFYQSLTNIFYEEPKSLFSLSQNQVVSFSLSYSFPIEI